MSTQEKKRRGPRAVVAKRSAAATLALAVVLGSSAAGEFAASAASSASSSASSASSASGTTYNSSASEPDTWIPGQTQIPVLKKLIKGTTFLDWSRPGLLQTVNVRNTTGQNIYVLQRTKVMFVLADMAAAGASLYTGIASGGFGIKTEAVARSAMNSIELWTTTLQKELKALHDKKYTAQEKADGQVQSDVAKAFADAATSLNGDAATLYNGVIDLFGRRRANNAQSALADGNKFDDLLFQKIKDQALTIKNNATTSVRSDNYRKNLVTWGVLKTTDVLTGSLAADFAVNPVATVANELLGVVNIFGVSGVAGQLGFPTVDMYVIRDDKYGVHMTTAPNVSWIASGNRISPATTTPSGNLSSLEGIGYYTWRDMTSTTLVDDQTLYRTAYNALESNGFDAAAATKIIAGVLTGLTKGAAAGKGGAGFTEKTAAQLVLQPNFRKLVWLEYYTRSTAVGFDQATQAGTQAQQAVADAISKADSKWAADPVTSLENAALKGLSKGSATGGFSVWSQDASYMYDACVSATWYGANFWDTQQLLQHIGNNFDFGTSDVWTSSAPDMGAHIASEYVQIVAAMLASTGNVNDALTKIDDLLITFGGNPGQVRMPSFDLLEWWDQKGGFPASKPVTADNIAHKLKLGSHRDYCLTFPSGSWSDGAQIVVDDYFCNHFNDNTAEEWTFATNGQLQAGGDGKYCLTAFATPGASGVVSNNSVLLKPCSTGTSGQQWRRYSDQTIHLYSDAGSGPKASPSRDTGYCLASQTATPTEQTNVLTAKCNAADPAQVWTFSYYSNIPSITFNSLSATKSRQSVNVNITYTCTADVAKITAYANEAEVVYGNGEITPTCDGASHSATITVRSQDGLLFAHDGFGYAWAVMVDAHGQELAGTPRPQMAFP